MPNYDVVVIGAGLAGLQAARLLGKRGLKVLLVDRKASVEKPVYITGIFVRKTLEDFDLPEDCLGPMVRHVTLYSPGGRRLPLESPKPEFRVGRIGKLYRRFLVEAIEAGVEWLPSTHYLKAEPEGEEVRLHLGVRERSLSIRAHYLIGADGARSRVAQDLETAN
jgi:flavin-dependent dehydrogenase